MENNIDTDNHTQKSGMKTEINNSPKLKSNNEIGIENEPGTDIEAGTGRNTVTDSEEQVNGNDLEKDEVWQNKIDEMDSLPYEERMNRYRKEVKLTEDKILALTGDPLETNFIPWESDEETADKVEALLLNRDYLLSKMFEQHCSDKEIKRMESVNSHLYELTQDMFSRTAKMYRAMIEIPKDGKDNTVCVEGTLRFSGETEDSVIQLEDDGFYCSDFTRMILINSSLHKYAKGDLEIISCFPPPLFADGDLTTHYSSGKQLSSAMSDEELDLNNYLDDGKSWAESWLHHPKLNHICMCYATHAIVTHDNYPIPDLLRMKSFEVKVEVTIRQWRDMPVNP